MSVPPQLALQHGGPRRRRGRKTDESRLAVQDAALDLFVRQGYEATTVDEIAAAASISPATFFRYFGSKSEVIYNDPDRGLPALWQAIIERPDSESDLAAISHAIQSEWIANIDPDRAARQHQAIASSPLLRGLSTELGRRWQSVISDALARRRRLRIPDEECELAAATALAVFGKALDAWAFHEPRGDLAHAVEHEFQLMATLCARWSKRNAPARQRR